MPHRNPYIILALYDGTKYGVTISKFDSILVKSTRAELTVAGCTKLIAGPTDYHLRATYASIE